MNDGSKFSLYTTILVLSILITNSLNACQFQNSVTDVLFSLDDMYSHNQYLIAYNPHAPININSNTDFESQGFPGNGTLSDPYVISGFEITTTQNCIQIENTDAYFVISECFLHGESFSGVHLVNVTNGVIFNNIISEKNSGVYSIHCSNICILNNTISDNDTFGIHFSESSNSTLAHNFLSGSHTGAFAWDTSNLMVLNNTISESGGQGIFFIETPNSTIANNTISENFARGLEFGYATNCTFINNILSNNGEHGAVIESCEENLMVNNSISGNNGTGLLLISSFDNIVHDNVLMENTGYGISCQYGSESNQIYLNILAFNELGNAVDNGTMNHWNTTGLGNYWSDYSGFGVYTIPGSAGSIDYHPFAYPERFSNIILVVVAGIGFVAVLILVLVIRFKKK